MKRFIGRAFAIVLVVALSSFPAYSDDTELFTTRANPDVLLVVDASPSMNTVDPLANPAVPNLNTTDPGDGNQRFDIIWKVLYSLLNHDASSPGGILNFSGTLKSGTTVGATQFEVTSTYYNQFPATPSPANRIIVGAGTEQELVGYASKLRTGTRRSNYRYFINIIPESGSGLAFAHTAGDKFDFLSSYANSNAPLDHADAISSTYINNIDSNDMASFRIRLGLMTYTNSSSSSSTRYGGLIENQQRGTGLSPVSPNDPPFSPTYRDIWNSVISTSGQHGVRDKGSSTPTTLALKWDVPLYFTRASDTNAVCRRKYVVLITDGEDTRGLGSETNTNPRYYYPGKTLAECGTSPNNYPADQYSGCYIPEATVPPYSTTPTLASGSAVNRFYPNAWENFNTGNPGGQVQRHNWLIEQGKILKDAGVELFVVGVGLSGNQQNAASGPKTAHPMNVALRHVLRRVAQQANVQTSAQELYNIGTGYGGTVEDTSISIVPDPITGKPIEHAFFGTSADELSEALGKIFRSITTSKYSFTAPTVATVRTTDKNYLYTAYFEPGAPPDTLWPGHIYCRTLYDNGAINPTLRWDAAAPDNVSLSIPVSSSASSRRIFVGLDDSMLSPPFKRGYFSTGTSSWGDPGVTAGDLGLTAGADNVIAWVRGAYFDNNVKLGDIYHSKPILISNPSKIYFDEGFPAYAAAKEFRPRVLYAGANDGMLHAFLAGVYNSSTKTWTNGTGEELFGYIPGSLLSSVQQMVQTGVSDHGYFVDSSPRVADVWWDTNGNNVKEASEWRTVLIGGMRKGGEGYYALDVTDPPTGGDYSNFPKVLWEYSDDTVMAESWSEPVIGKVRIMDAGVARDRFVAILGAGPNIGGGSIGKAVMVLDVRNGQVLRTFTGMGSGVAASPTAILDSSGYIRFAYVVDINGNLWKFDFRTPGNATSSTPDSVWTATKLFTPATGGQPAYHRVEVAYTSTDGSSRYLFYGTGDQDSPVTNLGSGKFYGIKDTDAYFPSTAVVETSSNLLDVTPTILNNAAGGTVSTSQSGWVVKLGNVTQSYDGYSHSGEKVLSDPVVFYGRVYFTTFTANTTSPCDGGGSQGCTGWTIRPAAPG